LAWLVLLVGCVLGSPGAGDPHGPGLVGRARPLTLEGLRTGEGYFDRDGRAMVFQSEREPGNPFYQIYWMDLETGRTDRVSPGHGKTTCAWVHPSGDRVLFASTHEDPEARAKQQAELELRASGGTRRYSWDYDEHYELYALQREGVERGALHRLTRARGYDAEASYSPDGGRIVFSSNRHAYEAGIDPEAIEADPSRFVDLYLMNADGSQVRRLTDTPGYDGGPFFSPDGTRIVWRRFSEDGATAEIHSMALDGSQARQLTRLGAMSWAPFYHPSGKYVVFATNLHGFANFELYLVDTAGEREPVRVTDHAGFDGLPVFSPDGRTLAWTSNRGGDGRSQIWLAPWNHAAALALLGLPGDAPAVVPAPEIGVEELRAHVAAITSDAMEGRETGTPGEALAASYIAGVFERLGLEPAGDGGWLQPFEFAAGVSLGAGNALRLGAETLGEVDASWRPLAFSRSGASGPLPVVFAGYGLVVPETADAPGYDSYGDLEVEGKWVVVMRFAPEDVSPEQRTRLARFAGLRYKATIARDKGAAGLLVVAGPLSEVRDPLVPLRGDASLAGVSLFAASIDRDLAARLLGRDLESLQAPLETGDAVAGFQVDGPLLEGEIDLVTERRSGRNVVARLRGTAGGDLAPVVIGAHYDHLGRGTSDSLAEAPGEIHRGADDNASGVAVVLEVAGELAADPPRRDVIFAAWSGEEVGLLGSAHFVRDLDPPNPHSDPLERAYAAYLNLDMVGRLREELVVWGINSSPAWRGELERANVAVGLPLELQDDSYVPSDGTSFYLKGIPSVTAFTGAHAEYHTPADTADLLDYEGMRDVGRLVERLAVSLGSSDELPEFVEAERPEGNARRAFLRAWLGTIPDYAPRETPGLPISGVMKGGPADEAGLRAGDVIVELGGRRIENIYDYTYAIESLAVGETVQVTVERGGERHTFDITPRSRD
jgi:Tol biopolymer transport system component